MIKNNVHSDYLETVFLPEKLRETIEKAVFDIRAWQTAGNKFDAIAFCGMSGAALAFSLSARLNVPLLCIRKNIDNCHSQYLVEGFYNVRSYIIVDDFADSGSTLSFIEQKVFKYVPSHPRLAGIYFWDHEVSGAFFTAFSAERYRELRIKHV